MKKKYISPSIFTVRLSAIRPLAASTPDVGIDNSTDPVLGSSLDVNEYKGITDVNLWDNEW